MAHLLRPIPGYIEAFTQIVDVHNMEAKLVASHRPAPRTSRHTRPLDS